MFVSFATPRRLLGAAAVLSMLVLPAHATAQSAAEHVTLGDREHAAMNAPGALQHYEAAITADPKSYDALWKGAREAVDVGEFNASPEERDRLYTLAELYARRAVEANPADAEGHFHLARSLGRKALSLGARDRVKYAGDIRAHALEALKIDPKHPGAQHVMGMWNYNIMRLSGLTRFMAKNFLGGRVFDSANWDDAQRYMEESVANEPNRLVHRLDLARVYAARGDRDRARAQFDATMRGTPTEFNDRHFQSEASAEIKDVQ
jgi:tetratricopeptide (TPR) repeat protein